MRLPKVKKHVVHKLFEKRLAQCTKPFNARGGNVVRCPQCRIDERHCLCVLRPSAESNAAFLLLYYDDEVLKPSNSGKLIADLFDDTHAFIWQRTQLDDALKSLINDPQWYPVVIFPEEYADAGREVIRDRLEVPDQKRPLFILLDGSWPEAKKMFRKSPYLDSFPVMSISPENRSKYIVRKASMSHQLATAEVASFVLDAYNEPENGELLRVWFDVFSYRYQKGVMRVNKGDPTSEDRLKELMKRN